MPCQERQRVQVFGKDRCKAVMASEHDVEITTGVGAFEKSAVCSNPPAPVVCSTSYALALAAVHLMAEPLDAGGVGADMPAKGVHAP
jgi:hypothetical protein